MVLVTPIRAGIILAALTLICHAVLPFTDYVTYDDLYMINWVQRGDLDSLNTMYSMCGGQIGGAYFGAFAGLGDLVTPFKIAGVVFSLATGWLAWRVGIRCRFLTAGEALLVAAVAISFPAYKVKGGFVYSVYDWTPAVFLLATLLALRAEDTSRTATGHVARRVLALLLFAISFQMPSLLMFYGGFYWLYLLVHQRCTGREWFNLPWGFVARRADYLLLPFVYYVLKNALFPTWGNYAIYNKPELSLPRFETAYRTLPGVLTDPFTLFAAYPVAVQGALAGAAAAIGLVGWLVLRARADQPAGPLGGTKTSAGLFAFGLVLLVLGTFPYAAVGREFGPAGQGSSYTPLIPLPMGILALGLVRMALRAGPSVARLLPAAFAAVVVCWGAAWWHNYLTMQAVEARNQAVLAHLRAHPQARECSVYCVLNLYRVPRTFDNLHGWEWCYIECGTNRPPRSYAYNGLPDLTVTPPWFVRQSLEETTIGYSLPTVDVDGKQGILVVRPRASSPPYTGFKYLANRYVRPGRLAPFLDRLVEIEFYPAPWNPARIKEQVEARR